MNVLAGVKGGGGRETSPTAGPLASSGGAQTLIHGSVVSQPACPELVLRAYAEQHSLSRASKASQTLIRHRAATSDIICLASVKEVATAENFELVVTLLRTNALPHNHRPLFLCRHDTQWRLRHISTLTSTGRRQINKCKLLRHTLVIYLCHPRRCFRRHQHTTEQK